MFRQILGQDQVIRVLNSQIDNDRVAQAYLFHGQDGVGKYLTALMFAMGLNCLSLEEYRPCGVCNSCRKFMAYEHPDFIYLFPTTNLQMSPDGEIKNNDARKQYLEYLDFKRESPWLDYNFGSSVEIRKESVMMLSKRLEISSVEAKYRVVIIENADLMNVSTANAFLKKLEEPPPRTVLILITERISMLLPTIVSRCQQMFFKPLSTSLIERLLIQKFDIDSHLARSAARISNGSFKEAYRLCGQEKSKTRDFSFELTQMALDNDQLALHKLLQKGRDFINQEELQELIRFLSIIVNDLCLYDHDPLAITNIDKAEMIASISSSRHISDTKAYDFLVEAQRLNRLANGNVNLSLIMIKLFHSLRQSLTA